LNPPEQRAAQHALLSRKALSSSTSSRFSPAHRKRLLSSIEREHNAFHRMLTTIKVAAISFLLSAFSLAAPKNLDLGGMVLSISDAPTAQIFHIVDQLSHWDIYTHDQYARWAAATHLLDQRDRELLRQHAEMRKRRGWGHGFEQTFLVEDSIEDAAAKGISTQFLSATEANTERDILIHFAPKLEPLLRQRRTEIAALQQQLVAEQARLTPLMVQLASFAEVKNPPIVMVFLVANTEEHNGGGGVEGGRLVVEVPLLDTIGTLLHECSHQLLDPQKESIHSAAEAAKLDYMMLNEGIAYALYPGIMADTEQGDRLIEELVRRQLRGTPASDPFLQFDMVAAVIRPLLRTALAHHETITIFLPEATAKWRSVAAP
jgi:hypothetical protein